MGKKPCLLCPTILDMVPYDLSLKKKKKSEQAENISIKADSLLIVVSYILFKSK